jgi:hypothetical protein
VGVYDAYRDKESCRCLLNAFSLLHYQTQNFYLLDSRTNTVSLMINFLTWTLKDFSEQIDHALERTLLDEAILKQTYLSNYLLVLIIVMKKKQKKRQSV